MPRPPLKTAVVGIGRIAWSDHLPALKRYPKYFELVAAVDPLPERREEAKKEFDIPEVFAELDELFARIPDLDLMVVASPTLFHTEQSIRAMEHGCHVFCDKPLTLSGIEARQIAHTAAKTERKITVYLPRRLNAETLTVKKILAEGKLGRIFQIKLFVGNYARRNDWQALLKNGGGMLYNYGTHYLDQLQYATTDKITNFGCILDRVISLGDADDVVKIIARTQNEVTFDLDINQAAALFPPKWQIFGDCGTAQSCADGSWELRYCDPDENSTATLEHSLAAVGRKYPGENVNWHTEKIRLDGDYSAIVNEFYRNLYDYITIDAPPIVPIDEVVELVELIDRCHAKKLR